jgi:hypothetical protein
VSSELLPPEAAEPACPRCKVLRTVMAQPAASRRVALAYARTFNPHPSHVRTSPGPFFVTGVLCESLVLGVGRIIHGGKA